MEINKYTDIVGVVVQHNIVEGRMGLLSENLCDTVDFGSRNDLMGVKLPATAAESARAKFCIAFALDNRPTPLMTVPSYSYALRRTFDQATNVPFATTVYLSHPGNMDVPQTIASGELALAFDRGVFTVTSGNFIASETLVPGAFLSVANVDEDGSGEEGKLKYSASAAIAVVERYDTTNQTLTFRTL